MAVSVYDKQFLNDDQQKQLAAITDEWNRANAAGDRAGMDAAHAAAESVRQSGYGYSGGGDGSGFSKRPIQAAYTAPALPSYRAQTDAVNSAYNAAQEVQLAQLKTSYDANEAALQAARAKIPENYQLQRDATYAQSEIAGRDFNEYAAASGLNTGAAGQATLSRQNTLQGNLSALGRAEANALSEIDTQLAQLKIAYQNQVAEAIAKGEYERAAALTGEYQTQEKSMVSVAQSQADLNYREYAAGQEQSDKAYERAWAEDQRAYSREQDAYNRTRQEEDLAYNRGQEDYERQLSQAKTLAQYGDFSGYAALYGEETAANMRRLWIASNPLLALNTGVISADEYYKLTGQYPSWYGGTASGSGSYSGRSGGTAGGKGTDTNADGQGMLKNAGDSIMNWTTGRRTREAVSKTLTNMAASGADDKTIREAVDQAVQNGFITPQEGQEYFRMWPNLRHA